MNKLNSAAIKNDLYCPFPLASPPSTELLVGDTANWLMLNALSPHEKHANIIAQVGVDYISCCYPDTQPRRMQELSRFAAWNCILDDFVEQGHLHESPGELIHFLSCLKYVCEQEHPYPQPTLGIMENQPLVATITEMKKQMGRESNPAAMRNLMSCTSHFISGLIWEIATNIRGRPLDINTFCALRTHNSGMYMAIAMAEYASDAVLSSEERANPILQAACKSLMLVLVIDNDIYSYAKEHSNGHGVTSNILDIFQRTRQTDLQGALQYTITLRNQSLLCYQRLRARYWPEPDIRIATYFRGLEDIVSGNLVFGNINARYATPDQAPSRTTEHGPHTLRFSGGAIHIVKTWTSDSQLPHIIPAIAWWWSWLE
ncbi:terpene synthase family protein [Pseudomonas chlororaphis]|uniref:terpene synthase family protein n=1 Tax=Pseudomonas chlororaphis TaxID=587753 RepID=UPI000F554369|nr:terpene synthase family protein [Pseudomonas chlororaphis]AZD48532.1 hypothetical protein C4K20_3117 [Pseudomonas chlororaphis subsp. aurantiaca]QQX57574.1 hypothetical protein JHW28_23840 [Pseudomonas chlororaphis subsp. aurantiaca]